MILFLDASALVKLYRNEDGSPTMHALFDDAEYRDSIIISDVVALEVIVRLAKGGRDGGRKERRRARQAITAYSRDRAQILNVHVTGPEVVRDAELAAVRYSDSGAGTLDLLHTAFVLRLRDSVPDALLVFVVADRKLRHLAERAGLRTFDPEIGDPQRVGA